MATYTPATFVPYRRPWRLRIRVDKRESARLTYRWLRRCGYSRPYCLAYIECDYGWTR